MSVLDAIDAEIKSEDEAIKPVAPDDLSKPVEAPKPTSGVLGSIDAEIEAETRFEPFSGKKAEELDSSDYEVLNYLSPEKLTEVSNTRKDIPLPDDLLRKKFDYQRSLPWNEGIRTMEDWYNLGAGVIETGKSFGKGVAKVVKNVFDPTGDQGWQSIKDFVAPAVELPEKTSYLATKLYEGGMDWTDRLSEKFGFHDQEKSFENYKARHLVDQIQAQAAAEDPSVYGRLIKSDFVKEGLAQIALSTIPDAQTISEQEGVSLEEAQQIRKNRAYQIAEQTASEKAAMEPKTDEDIATAGTFLLPSSLGLGEMGAVALGAEAVARTAPQLVRGLKYLGKTDAEIKAMNDAAQVLEKQKALGELERRQQPSFIGRAAGATAEKIDAATIALKNISEKTPQFLKDVVPVVGGGAIGYGLSDENRGGGVLTGALLGKAGSPALKMAAYATKIPALVREIDAARAIAAGGTKGTFETLGGIPNVSKEAAKILRYGGKRIDDILENSVEYAKAGIHGTTLALATGALESASPEELNNMLASGLFYIGGGRAAHHLFGKLTGVDPVVEARERRQQAIDDLKTYQNLDPESRVTLNSVTSWDNVIANRQKIVQDAEVAYNDAVARGSKDVDKLAQNLKAQRTALSMLNRANVQTRNEYGRDFITMLSRTSDLVNGSLRAGQNNVGIQILTTKQIFDRFRKDPANSMKSDAAVMEAANQRGFYSLPEGSIQYRAGMGMETPKKDLVFDRTKPSVVVNADHVNARGAVFGESLMDVLTHEIGHHVSNIPEFREINKDAESLLFSQEIKDANGNVITVTSGRYSPKDLMDMYINNYMRGKTPEQIKALSELNGAWDQSRQALDENAVAAIMRDEILAELNSGTISRHLGKDLDSGTLHLLDVARLKTKKNLFDRAVQKFYGLGGKGDAISPLTGAEYSPEVLSANRQAIRAIKSLQGELSPAVEAPEEPKISKAEIRKNAVLQERYAKYGGTFETKIQGQIFDGNGNPVGSPIEIANPNAAEGSWQNRDGEIRQTNGYGQRPDEFAGINIPDGGSLVVARQIVREADGVTPKMLQPKDAKKLIKNRGALTREILNTPDEGAPSRFEPTGDPDGTWRGRFTPLQIEAIKNAPESIIPKKIKEYALALNDAIVKEDGSRIIVDYAAVMNDNGRYVPFSAKLYDVVPIGMHLSKDGHLLVTTISVGRLFDKLNKWSERMPARLSLWGGSKDAFFKEFTDTYLRNWQNNLAGETGLSGTTQEALAKKNIFNDFLNLATKDTAPLNPDRTRVPRRKGDVRGKDIDRTIMSIRLDHIAELIDNEGATKVPIDYQKAKFNLMPAEPVAETPQEQRKPSAIDLGITAAHSKENAGFGISYVGTGEQKAIVPASNENIQDISKRYVESVGITHNPHNAAVPVNEETAKRIADYYDQAGDNPNDPAVRKAYTSLANEVVAQWKAFEDDGYTAEPWTKEGQPYANSREMMEDVRNNKHIYYFQTESGYGESGITDKMREQNPMLAASGIDFGDAKNVPVNDVFRVVHDIVGHGANGYEFGPKGEFNAYLEHSRMFSGDAKPALAAETLAQNSWVNYGSHLRDETGKIPKKGEKGYVPVTERPFAEQKNIIIPQEILDEVDRYAFEQKTVQNNGIRFMPSQNKDMQVQFKSEAKAGSVKGRTFDLVHFGSPNIKKTNPKKMGKAYATPSDLRGTYKSYFYVNGTNYEEGISGGTPYIAKVDGNSIYDLSKDVLNVVGMPNREKMEETIKKAGYAGYYSPKSFSGSAFDAVAMFKPVALTVAEPSDIYSKKKLAALGKQKTLTEEPDYQTQDDAWQIALEKLMQANRKASGISFMPAREGEERITDATYTNPRTGEVSRGKTHLEANPKAPKEATDRESPAYGFETDTGRIVDRNEAFQIAQEAGQLKAPAGEEDKFHADRGVLHSNMVDYEKSGISFMPKVAVVPERFTGTGEEESRRGKYVEPPKFFGKFNVSQYEKGGKFFDAETGEDITDRSYESASISVDGGKPSLVANNEAEGIGTGPIFRSNLFKQKAGWKWISENAPETSTIVSVEGQGKHIYTLRADFQNGVKMARYPDKTSEPRLRPTGRGELVIGQEIGRIDIRGKKHPVYDMVTIGEKPTSDLSFMPASGESKPVPTQEQLDEMKARLPKYRARFAEGEKGNFAINIYNDQNKYVGFVDARYISDGDGYIRINDIAVSPEYQKQGYGEALYREVAKYAQEVGAATIEGDPVTQQAVDARSRLFETKANKYKNQLAEFDYAWAGSKVPSDIRFMPKSEEPEITEEGHVFPKEMDKPFSFTPQIAINFMPATEKVNLEDYIDRPIISLAADRMGIGQAYVGPTGAKQPLSMESQGGAGFSTLYRDEEHNPIWAFSTEQAAKNFLKRINDVAELYKTESVLVAPTLLAADNHLKNQTGQLGYVEAMEAALKAKMVSTSALNSQINEIIKRISESKSKKAKQATKRLEGISTFKEFAEAVRKQSFNFADAEWIMKKAAQKKLPITAKELDQMGLLPSQIAKDLAHDGYYELPNFSVVSLFEVPKGQKPEKGMYHNAYPYIVRGKSIGYLKNIINLADVTKEPKVFTKKGQITAQPLMTVMPIIDQSLAKKALDTLKAYSKQSN